MIDYPGKISAVIFTQGCNFKCRFCYNPALIARKKRGSVSEKEVLDFLRDRRHKLEGVVITGGEPTLQPDLSEFLRKIKNLGFVVKLDTNGTNLEMLWKLITLKLVDYVAMDVKSSFGEYTEIVQVPVDLKQIGKSMDLLMGGGIPYEFRTTVLSPLIKNRNIRLIGKRIYGADKWYLQEFKNCVPLVDKSLRGISTYTYWEMQEFRNLASRYVKTVGLR